MIITDLSCFLSPQRGGLSGYLIKQKAYAVVGAVAQIGGNIG